ncbi:MAG: hypothetical protein K9G43_08405 [Rhodobacteraceae bacterium]|nr:hypothetical protein [Paracoccaceae bacterium]
MRLALALCLMSGPVFADEQITFHTPSGNILCALSAGTNYATASCYMFQMTTQSYARPPADCEFDWGNSFSVTASGKGKMDCYSDFPFDGSGLELGYGQKISLGGITCHSAKTGMTCVNAAGHGFAIAKAKQELF